MRFAAVRDVTTIERCAFVVDAELADAGTRRLCAIPTMRVADQDVSALHVDDPEREHTVYPVCELHEISLYFSEGASDDVRG